jgi:hypothetical protein
MRTAHVQVVNASTAVTRSDARRVVRGLRAQARKDFRAAWGVDADVELVERGRHDTRAWLLTIVDGWKEAEDDGWHELTSHGQPLGKVYAGKAILEDGGWSTAASHELLEMLADPDISLAALVHGEGWTRLYAYEVCDPVQDDRWSYEVAGVRVSDFVLPSWFESFRAPRSTRFDHVGACVRPLQVLAGGYATICHADWQRGWHDLGPSRGKRGRSRGSRRSRRDQRAGWRRSRA